MSPESNNQAAALSSELRHKDTKCPDCVAHGSAAQRTAAEQSYVRSRILRKTLDLRATASPCNTKWYVYGPGTIGAPFQVMATHQAYHKTGSLPPPPQAAEDGLRSGHCYPAGVAALGTAKPTARQQEEKQGNQGLFATNSSAQRVHSAPPVRQIRGIGCDAKGTKADSTRQALKGKAT